MQVQETYRTPTRQEQTNTPYHFIITTNRNNSSYNKQTLETAPVTYQGRLIRITADYTTSFQSQNGLGRCMLCSEEP